MSQLGFWSYVRDDDEMDMERITELSRDVTRHYEGQTGDAIEIFLDVDGIRWGEDWQEKINATLSNVAFFIPVITPRFFKSAACRSELQFFANKADRLGVKELIMPLLYVDFPGLHVEEPEDKLISLVRKYNWRSWVDVRFTDRDSAEYRRAVNDLALELVSRMEHLNTPAVVEAVEAAALEAAAEDGPGVLDRLALMEEAMPRWGSTIERIGVAIVEVGRVMQQGTEDIEKGNRGGKAYAARLTVTKRVAKELEGPVAEVEELGQDFAADLANIDDGIRLFFTQVDDQNLSNDDLASAKEMGDSLMSLADVTEESMGAAQRMIGAIEPLETMSRDLRKPLQRLRSGLTSLTQAQQTTKDWADLASERGFHSD